MARDHVIAVSTRGSTLFRRLFLVPIALLVPAIGRAAEVQLGVSAGLLADLPDAAGGGSSREAEQPSAAFPVGDLRLHVDVGTGSASFRATFAADAGPGQDTVYWWDDGWQRSSDHWTFLGAGALLLGPAVRAPLAPRIEVVLAAQAGLMGVAFFHSFGDETQALLDPASNDLDDPDNIDPYTLQAIGAFDALAGLRFGGPGATAIEADLGWTSGWIPAAGLQKSPADAAAARTAVGLDALRFSVGVVFPLGRRGGPS